MGRTLTSGCKLSATLPEIIRAARAETERINDDEGPPKGQRKQPAHIINAALCWFFAQPPEDRDRILRAGYQTLIAHMALDRPAPIPVGRSRGASTGVSHAPVADPIGLPAFGIEDAQDLAGKPQAIRHNGRRTSKH